MEIPSATAGFRCRTKVEPRIVLLDVASAVYVDRDTKRTRTRSMPRPRGTRNSCRSIVPTSSGRRSDKLASMIHDCRCSTHGLRNDLPGDFVLAHVCTHALQIKRKRHKRAFQNVLETAPTRRCKSQWLHWDRCASFEQVVRRHEPRGRKGASPTSFARTYASRSSQYAAPRTIEAHQLRVSDRGQRS